MKISNRRKSSTGEDKKLLQTKSFQMAILAPILLAIILLFAIHYFPETSNFISKIWNDYKIPMAIASLSIPLVAWVTANYHSEQNISGLKLQRDKRLYEMYYEQQNHFEKVMGRRINNSKFEYITAADLPVIFSELYEFNKLNNKRKVSLKLEAPEQINKFLENTEKIIFDFYCHFTEEKESNPEQPSVLDGLIYQLYKHLSANLQQLSGEIGVRPIELSDASVDIFCKAYSEIIQMSYFMGNDFKIVWDMPLEEDGRTKYENVTNTFNAIEEVIREHMGVVGSANFNNLQHDTMSRQIINMVKSDPLQRLVYEKCQNILEELLTYFEFYDIRPTESKYIKYTFTFLKDSTTLQLWFEELNDSEGYLVLTIGDTDIREKIEFIDLDKSKYKFGEDMGRVFIGNCIKAINNLLKTESVKKSV